MVFIRRAGQALHQDNLFQRETLPWPHALIGHEAIMYGALSNSWPGYFHVQVYYIPFPESKSTYIATLDYIRL